MYVHSYIMARSRNRCCHGKERIRSCLIVGVYLAVNVNKVFNIDMEMQQWVHFALLSSHQIFHTAIKNTGVL